MKFILLFNIIFAHDDDNGSIGYLCNQCDLYDINTNTLFEKLDKPEFRGARPKVNSTTGISVNVTCNDGNVYNYNRRGPKSFGGFFSIVDRTTLIFAAASSIIGLINLVATVTLVVTERKISSSARKTYMQTAILENE